MSVRLCLKHAQPKSKEFSSKVLGYFSQFVQNLEVYEKDINVKKQILKT